MLRPIPTGPLTEEAELLLLALVASSCPQAQVDFEAGKVAPLLGWPADRVSRTFDFLRGAGYLSPLEAMPTRSQIDGDVVDWVWTRAAWEIDGDLPHEHQDAARHLLRLRLTD